MKKRRNPILIIIPILIVLTLAAAFTYDVVLKPYIDGEKKWWYLNTYGAEDEAEADIAETDLVVSDTALRKIDENLYEVTFKLKNNSDYNIKVCGVCYEVYKYSGLQYCGDFQYTKRIKSGEEVEVKGEIEKENILSVEMCIYGFFADVDGDRKTWMYLLDDDMKENQKVNFPE
ncbi:MAG: hypothetical protein IJC79_03270 [Clostridia bacterium]|nr:hypothetical protein [Clostridia bacterium]